MNTILVTGAAGFIGSHLVPWLAQRDPQRRVYALIRPGVPPPAPAAGVYYVPWDLATTRPLAPHAAWDERPADTDEQRLPGHVDAVPAPRPSQCAVPGSGGRATRRQRRQHAAPP